MKTPPKGISRELQVGFFVMIALLVVAAFSFFITDTPVLYSGTRLTAYLDDATGLFRKSKVKMAGIDIGLVTDIRLVEGRAEIELTIDKNIEIPVGAKVVPRPLGILGDKYLEIAVPDPKAAGSQNGEDFNRTPQSNIVIEGSWLKKIPALLWPEASAQSASPRSSRPSGSRQGGRTLEEGDVIPSVNSGATIDDLTRQLAEVTHDLKIISSTIRKLVEGSDVNSPMGRTLKNTEELTANLNRVIQENRQDMRQITSSLAKLSRSLEDVSSDDPKKGVSKEIQNLAKSADRLAQTIKNIENITGKIDRGEGTLGRLVNDPTTASEFNKALVTLNAALDRAERTRVFLEAVPEYNVSDQEMKTYVGLRLAPRDNTSYIGQLVVRPQGTTTTKITRTRIDGGPETVTEETVQDPSGLAFSFQYAKRFWSTAFRVGLFENTGGAGVDQYLFQDILKLSTEIYDFEKGQSPNLKATISARFMGIFVVQAGMERMISDSRFAFVGAGLSFSDEDLKTVLLLPGVP